MCHFPASAPGTPYPKSTQLKICDRALVGFQGLMLKCASETLNVFIRPLKQNDFKEDAGHNNQVIRPCYIHDPGIQQEPYHVQKRPSTHAVGRGFPGASATLCTRGSHTPGSNDATGSVIRPRSLWGTRTCSCTVCPTFPQSTHHCGWRPASRLSSRVPHPRRRGRRIGW